METVDQQLLCLARISRLPTFRLELSREDSSDGGACPQELRRAIERCFEPIDMAACHASGEVCHVSLPLHLHDLLLPMSYGYLLLGPFFVERVGEEEYSLLLAGAGLSESEASLSYYRSLPYLPREHFCDLCDLACDILGTRVVSLGQPDAGDDAGLMRELMDSEFERDFIEEAAALYTGCARALARRDMGALDNLSDRYARLIERTPPALVPTQRDMVYNEYVLMCSLYHEARSWHATAFMTYLRQRLDASLTAPELAAFQREMTRTLARKLSGEASHGESAAVARVRLYIHDHYQENVTLARLAEVAGLSESRLSARFAQECGQSVTDCLLGRRVEQAKRLLRYSSMPVKDIAGLCGFPDASYFSRRFRQATGMTPREFRRS